MSSDISIEEETEVVLEAIEIESSEDPPMQEWSSLEIILPEENRKRRLYSEGLYTPGSGDVCAKYVAMSQSSVFRHPYYNYPAVLDPGIFPALQKPEQVIIYPDDGQELYIDLCKQMDQAPVRMFAKGLLDIKIDLSYYGVNPNGVRPMSLALRFNKNVKCFNLTDNFLNDDASYHLGEMLVTNTTMTELNLAGCRIGPEGAKRLFANLPTNRGVVKLNLSRNQIGDVGVEYLVNAVAAGLDIKEIYLSYNNISGRALAPFADAFLINNKFTVIDLSWNNLFGIGTNIFLNALADSKCLLDLNLAWNSIYGDRISLALKNVITAPNLRTLNLSNNKLEGEDITNIITLLGTAKKLVTLDLSYNPMTPDDALKIISKMKFVSVKVKNVYMDSVFIDHRSLTILKRIQGMKSKTSTVITYGGIIAKMDPVGTDARDLVLDRAMYLCRRPKRNKKDIGMIVLELEKKGIEKMGAKEFFEYIEATEAPLEESLINEFVTVFPGPKSAKTKYINIKALVDYVHRKWPNKKLPITPPPEPEPEPEPEPPPIVKEVKGKGKNKGKK